MIRSFLINFGLGLVLLIIVKLVNSVLRNFIVVTNYYDLQYIANFFNFRHNFIFLAIPLIIEFLLVLLFSLIGNQYFNISLLDEIVVVLIPSCLILIISNINAIIFMASSNFSEFDNQSFYKITLQSMVIGEFIRACWYFMAVLLAGIYLSCLLD